MCHNTSVCARCYRRNWNGKCFACRRASARKKWPWGLLSKECHARRLEDEDGLSHNSCYYCGAAGAEVEVRTCAHQGEACARRTPVCERCLSLHGHAVSGLCWRHSWQGRCFKCKGALTQKSTYGRFCKKCFVLHTTQGQTDILLDEARAYLDSFREPLAISGKEPALQLLLLLRVGAAPLPAYAGGAEFFSLRPCLPTLVVLSFSLCTIAVCAWMRWAETRHAAPEAWQPRPGKNLALVAAMRVTPALAVPKVNPRNSHAKMRRRRIRAMSHARLRNLVSTARRPTIWNRAAQWTANR